MTLGIELGPHHWRKSRAAHGRDVSTRIRERDVTEAASRCPSSQSSGMDGSRQREMD